MTASTLSIVVPTYKASPFIAETLASVFAQTRLPDEVIVVDDCSPDDTVARVESIAAAAPVPVRVIRLPRNTGGPAKPLNVGVAAAGGEFIATLDHDDRLPPRSLELRLLAVPSSPDFGTVLGRVRLVPASPALQPGMDARFDRIRALGSDRTAGVRRVPGTAAYSALVEHGCYAATCSNLLFPKAVWSACGGFDESLVVACDYGFLQAVTARYDLLLLDADACEWKLSPESMMSVHGRRQLDRDILRVYANFTRAKLDPNARRLLRDLTTKTAHDLGYESRSAGRLAESAGYYLRGIRDGRPSLRCFAGLMKLGVLSLSLVLTGRGRTRKASSS